LEKLDNVVRNVDDTKSLDNLPVLALNQHFVQFAIKVTFENTALLGSCEKRIISYLNRKLFLFSLGSSKNWNFKLGINLCGVHMSDIIFPAAEIGVVDC
jgi:hypothetical protein